MSNLEKVKAQVDDTKILTVYDFFEKKKSLISKALPKTITVDKLIGLFTMIIKSSPKVMECSQSSLIAAVIQAIQLGLTPGAIGHIYLVPYNKQCQLIIGYKGLCQLINNSGTATVLSADVVKENDDFEYELGLNPVLRHKYAQEERGKIIGAWASAKNLLANEKVFVYLTKEDLDKIKKASKAAGSEFSPWNTWEEEMCKKSAVKRLHKLLPLSAEVQKQISADETIKSEISPIMVDVKDEMSWKEEEVTEIETKSTGYICEECTLPISKEEYEISKKITGKSLCKKCLNK